MQPPSFSLLQKYFPSNLCQVCVVGTFEEGRVYIRYTMQIQLEKRVKFKSNLDLSTYLHTDLWNLFGVISQAENHLM
jgi:hypothetical protein